MTPDSLFHPSNLKTLACLPGVTKQMVQIYKYNRVNGREEKELLMSKDSITVL